MGSKVNKVLDDRCGRCGSKWFYTTADGVRVCRKCSYRVKLRG